MFIRIEKSSGVPITRQILDQIRTQCAAGDLRSGDRLPSLRQLACELTVNQNTILRVYERLEAEGLIERRHGMGTFVSERSADDAMRLQHEQLQREADALVHHARSLGLGPKEIKSVIAKALEPKSPTKKETSK